MHPTSPGPFPIANSRPAWLCAAPWRWMPHDLPPWDIVCAWATRFRRFVRDYERLPETLAGFHLVAFAGLMLRHLTSIPQVHNSL